LPGVCTLLALRAELALACAAWLRAMDRRSQGMNWAIFSLLGVLCVLTGITTFFVVINRKSASVRAAESDESQVEKV
jgi:hypothetical protein